MRNIFGYKDEYRKISHEVLLASQDKNFQLITPPLFNIKGNQLFLLVLLNSMSLTSYGGLHEKTVFYVRL